MVVASVHVADVGTTRALRMLGGPGEVDGLLSADAAIAAPLRSGRVPRPMPGRIALVAFWEGDAALDRFLGDHSYAEHLAGGWRARLEPLRAFGTWPGLPEDIERSRAPSHDGPAVVVTLGRVRLPRIRRFLRTSRPAEAAALSSPGLLWGTALARPPFVSTLTLWESAEALSAYAYGVERDAHARAIAADRKKGFHHHSAFVRFRPVEVVGGLGGRNPLGASAVASPQRDQRMATPP
jgi:hypothetical protein